MVLDFLRSAEVMKADEPEKMEKVFYPHNMDHQPQKFQNKAKLELSETDVESRIEEVKDLIKMEEEIKEEWFPEDVILMYLRSRKFDVKKAVTCMKKTVAFIKKHMEFFEPMDPKFLDDLLENGVYEISPRRDSEGQSLGILRIGKWNPSKVALHHCVHGAALMALYTASQPMTQINGVKCIFDLRGNPLKYIRYITPYNVYIMMQFYLESLPLRLKAVHFISSSILTKMFMMLMNAVVSEKVRNRFFAHGKASELLTCIQGNILPTDLEGTLPEEEQTKYTLSKTLEFPNYITAIYEHFKSLE